MSNYFKDFPKVLYKFGSNEQPVYFQKLSKYADVVDTLKDKVSAYIEYEIRDFDRPDTLAYRLYGKSEYEWTFFLMNDRLKETGWPMTQTDLYNYAVNDAFTGYVATLDVSTIDSVAQYAGILTQGSTIELTGGSTGTIEKADLLNKQVYIVSDSDLTQSAIDMVVDGTTTVALTQIVNEYNAVHHYINDSDEWLDAFTSGAGKLPVTNLEHLVNENDLSKRIRIIKKQNIESVVSEFKRMLASY